MSKNQKTAKKEKKKLKAHLELQLRVQKALSGEGKFKSKCCKKYKKGEHKRCGKCPCFDLIKKVA